MRTDGVQMAEEAYQSARAAISHLYGDRYLPDGPRRYSTKAKNAQEAHEAIRPTDFFRKPSDLSLENDMARLYDLIWKRAAASQMEAAVFEKTTVELPSHDGRVGLRASGQVVQFDGFLKLYQEGRDETAQKGGDDEDDGRLPPIREGDRPQLVSVDAAQHFTEPPPRFSEASLVKNLEELGIGRPSTYASIISTLIDREYVKLDQKRFLPEDKGRLVTIFLEKFFSRYVEYDFTAGLEEKLDLVSDGKLAWKDLLRDFWKDFAGAIEGVAELRVSNVIDAINEVLEPHIFPPRTGADGQAVDPRRCPTCGEGQLSLKLGKFGAFIGCSRYPDCRYTRPFGVDPGGDGEGAIPAEGKVLGKDPDTGLDIAVRTGRFGPYVQLGPDKTEDGEKPKRSSIPKGWVVAELTFEQALKLIGLPRAIGVHPEDGEPITAAIGQYGPYVKHQKTYANLPDVNEVFEIGLNRAVALIAEKRAGGGRFARGGRGAPPPPLREVGLHPDGSAILLYSGRYGPYLKHGDINANIPKGADPATVTLEQAIELVDARAAAAPAKGKAKGKSKAKAKGKSTAGTEAGAKPARSGKTGAKPKARKGAAKDADAPADA
jgi:DNA topoisomerase I